MFLSIIIPVYNVKDYLEKCIESVVKQVEDDCEIILVDDGSTDGVCPKLCDIYAEKYPEIIRVIHKLNGGVGDARNVGIENAKGDYICFIDSDDYVLPGMIDALRTKAESSHATIIQFGFYVEKDGNILDEKIESILHNEALTLEKFPQFLTMAPNLWNRIWCRKLFVDNDIRFPVGVWYEDMCVVPKLFASADTIESIPQSYYVYVIHNNSIMHNTNVERIGEILPVLEDVVTWYKDNNYFEKYYNTLSKIAVFQILMFNSVRVAKIDPDSHLLPEFREFVDRYFPDYMHNPELNFWNLSFHDKISLILVKTKQYKLIQMISNLKN